MTLGNFKSNVITSFKHCISQGLLSDEELTVRITGLGVTYEDVTQGEVDELLTLLSPEDDTTDDTTD